MITIGKNIKILAVVVLVAVSMVVRGQEKIEMRSWRTHYSYNTVSQIIECDDLIWGVAEGALLSVDPQSKEVRTYSKLTGLNGNGIHKIFNVGGNLLVCYDDANIDILDSWGNVENIDDLSRKSMNGDKAVNGAVENAGVVYMACGFGIATLKLRKMEFGDTYVIGKSGESEPVLNIALDGKRIYALTRDALMSGEIGSVNLMNYQNWQKETMPEGDNLDMAQLGSDIYLLKADSSVWVRKNGDWSKKSEGILKIWADGKCLYEKKTNGEVDASGALTVNKIEGNPTAATFDGKRLWFSSYSGIESKNMSNGERAGYPVNGPASNYAWRIKYRNGRIMTVPGGRFADNYYRDGYVSWFERNGWKHLRGDNMLDAFPSHWVYDWVDVEVDPEDKSHFWVAGYGVGLAEFRNDALYKVYTCDNSEIETLFPDGNRYNYMRIDGLAYDAAGRLWMTNRGQAQIKYIERNGTWHSLAHSGLTGVQTLQDILIDNTVEGRKYVLCPRYKDSNTSYLFVFEDNGTPDDISDDQTKGFTAMYDQDGKQISFNAKMLKSIVQDKDGVIWIGTSEGVFNIRSKAKIFDPGFRCSRVKIAREDGSNLADYLLGTETINAIAVDGGNRKWFGTENGAFLVSADGQETLEHFTTENSPLLSNSVLSIGIDGETGEVFFGTAKGIISYQSDASEGKEEMSELHAYPNPVRPEYSRIVTITGLTEDAHVKICDVNGAVVYETMSNGGTATWDAEGIASGVYIATCFSEDGKKHGNCKILIIKE